MLTKDEVKNLFSLQGEIEMERMIRVARYLNTTDEMSPEDRMRVDKLERQLNLIDSLFAVLTDNEAFVIKRHVMDGLDWIGHR